MQLVAFVVDQVMIADAPGAITEGSIAISMVGAATSPTVSVWLADALPPEPAQVKTTL